MLGKFLRKLANLFRDDMTQAELEATLDDLARKNASALDWRRSIVDLLKLLELDSSFDARAEMARDVGIESYNGSAEDNLLLHEAVLDRVAMLKIPLSKPGD